MAKFRTMVVAPIAAWGTVQALGYAAAVAFSPSGAGYTMGAGVPVAAKSDPATKTHLGSHFEIEVDLASIASDVPGAVAAINASMLASDPDATPYTEADVNAFLAVCSIDNVPNEGESDSYHYDRVLDSMDLVRWQDPAAV